jgi:hypothetical protein
VRTADLPRGSAESRYVSNINHLKRGDMTLLRPRASKLSQLGLALKTVAPGTLQRDHLCHF